MVTAALLYGVARLPEGKRKRQLSQTLQVVIIKEFDLCVLPFDFEASLLYAELVARQAQLGKPISMADAQIASICLHHEATKVNLINPRS